MTNRNDIMVDIETLGKKEGSSIIQIAAVQFNATTGEVLDTFESIGDIEIYDELKVDGDTLKWWLNTDKELLTRLLNEGTESESQLIVKFHNWLKGIESPRLWGNGILFDNLKIKQKCEKYGVPYPIHYKNDRDVRTILDLAVTLGKYTENEIKDSVTNLGETKHDALDDCLFQVRLVKACFDLLAGEPLTIDKFDIANLTDEQIKEWTIDTSEVTDGDVVAGDYVELLEDEGSCSKGEIVQISKVIKVYGEPTMTEYYIEGRTFIERDGSLGEPLFLYADEFVKVNPPQ